MQSGKVGSNHISLGGKRRNKRTLRRLSNMKSRISVPITAKRLRCFARDSMRLSRKSVKVTE